MKRKLSPISHLKNSVLLLLCTHLTRPGSQVNERVVWEEGIVGNQVAIFQKNESWGADYNSGWDIRFLSGRSRKWNRGYDQKIVQKRNVIQRGGGHIFRLNCYGGVTGGTGVNFPTFGVTQ